MQGGGGGVDVGMAAKKQRIRGVSGQAHHQR